MDLHSVEILSQKQISKGAFVLTFERKFDFAPGQSVAVSINKSFPPRLYSICSGVNTNYISIFYTIVPHGQLTPKLAQLNTGDNIYVSSAMGSFIHKKEQGFWIASGTGIAPYISMLESNIIVPLKLLHGISFASDAYYGVFLKRTLKNNYIACISKETTPNTFNGRITDWLKQAPNLPLDIMYYLCGNPEMVVDVRDILIEKGVPFKNIVSEIYF